MPALLTELGNDKPFAITHAHVEFLVPCNLLALRYLRGVLPAADSGSFTHAFLQLTIASLCLSVGARSNFGFCNCRAHDAPEHHAGSISSLSTSQARLGSRSFLRRDADLHRVWSAARVAG
jgi:hypothetical protein